MAQITIDIPDDKVSRVRDAFAGEYGWSPDLGVTKTQFTKIQVIKYIKTVVKNNEGNHQAGQARAAIENEVENITIT